MSTNTPNARSLIGATLKRCGVIVGVLGALAFGYQAGGDDAGVATDAPTVQVVEPREDDPGFDCRIHGNDICGPTGGDHEAGCYRSGVLVVPWNDRLYGQTASPCA